MHKILKCANATDSISLKCQDDGDTLTFVFKSTGFIKKNIYF